MKQIALILTLLVTLTLSSCDGMQKKTDSRTCSDRMDLQLVDGSAMWVYGGKVYDGYVKGNDEMHQVVYVPMCQIKSITIVDCENGK